MVSYAACERINPHDGLDVILAGWTATDLDPAPPPIQTDSAILVENG